MVASEGGAIPPMRLKMTASRDESRILRSLMVLQECSLFTLLAWTDCKWFHPLIIVLGCSEPCSLTKVLFNNYDNVNAYKMHPTAMGKLLNAFKLHLHIEKEKHAVGMFNVRAHWSVKNDQIHQLFLALTSL